MKNDLEGSASTMVLSSTVWSGIQIIVSQALTAAIFFILAHLIAPSSFGTVALAQSVLLILQAIAGLGLQQVLIQETDATDRKRSTIFYFGLIASLAIQATYSIAIVLFEPGNPEFKAIQLALAATLPISSLYLVHQASLMRLFGFRALAMRSIVAQTIAGTAGIVVALAGGQAWSIVTYRILVVCIEAVVIWAQYPWLPSPSIDLQYGRIASRKGIAILGVQLVSLVEARTLELATAYMLGLEAIAILVMTNRIGELAVQLTIRPFHSVVLPHVVRIRENLIDVGRFYTSTIRWIAWLSFPVYGVLFVYSDIIVLVFLGQKWMSVAPCLRIVCVNSIVYSVKYLYEPTLIGLGRLNELLKLRLAQTCLTVSCALVGLSHGTLEWLLMGQVVGMYLTGAVAVLVLRSIFPFPLGAIVRQGLPLAVVATGAAAGYRLASGFHEGIARLFVGGACELSVVGVLFVITERQASRALFQAFKRRILNSDMTAVNAP